MPRASSRSERPALPPCAGMLRMPLSALCVRLESPDAERLLQAFLSPILGAPPLPVPWQLTQVDSTTSLPLFCAAACADSARTAQPASTSDAMRRIKALLHRHDVVERGFQLGVGDGDFRMALAFLELRGEGRLLALLLRDVLVRRPDLLLVGLMAVVAALRFQHLGARLRAGGARGQRGGGKKYKHGCFHCGFSRGGQWSDCITHRRPARFTCRASECG